MTQPILYHSKFKQNGRSRSTYSGNLMMEQHAWHDQLSGCHSKESSPSLCRVGQAGAPQPLLQQVRYSKHGSPQENVCYFCNDNSENQPLTFCWWASASDTALCPSLASPSPVHLLLVQDLSQQSWWQEASGETSSCCSKHRSDDGWIFFSTICKCEQTCAKWFTEAFRSCTYTDTHFFSRKNTPNVWIQCPKQHHIILCALTSMVLFGHFFQTFSQARTHIWSWMKKNTHSNRKYLFVSKDSFGCTVQQPTTYITQFDNSAIVAVSSTHVYGLQSNVSHWRQVRWIQLKLLVCKQQ